MIALLCTLALADEAPPEVPISEVVAALSGELERNRTQLSLPDAPPIYHLRYQIISLDQVDVLASFGSVVREGTEPLNALGVEVRVGAPEFDNTGFGGWQNGFGMTGLPARITPRAASIDAWTITDEAYKEAVEQYARKTAQFTPPPDYPGDYTLTGPVQHDGGAARATEDVAGLVARAEAVSGALQGGGLERGELHVGHEAGQLWTVDSEGSSVRTPVQETTLRAVAHLRTADGMLLTDHALWTVRDPGALVPVPEMVAEAESLRDGLVALAEAPVLSEEYVGPVIFEGSAARDLFRYLLVPQLEGTPPEVPFDSFFGELGDDRDPVRLGRRVLPPGWSVRDDPQHDADHPGAFTHDLEGTPAQAVTTVTDGIVRAVLMSRVPRKGVDGTNGHGRGFLGSRARGRVSQLAVMPPRASSSAALVRKGLKAARAYGRDHVLVVRRLVEPAVHNRGPGPGLFMYDDEEAGARLPPPVSVTRVYADGSTETLRGAAFAGVQRWILRDITAAGPSTDGSFLAPVRGGYGSLSPTEGLSTRISAPSVLVGEVELVVIGGDPMDVPVLPPR